MKKTKIEWCDSTWNPVTGCLHGCESVSYTHLDVYKRQTLLATEVAVNRPMFTQQVGQKALVFKLNGRPQEGKILTIDEINEIGYKFQLLTRIS